MKTMKKKLFRRKDKAEGTQKSVSHNNRLDTCLSNASLQSKFSLRAVWFAANL